MPKNHDPELKPLRAGVIGVGNLGQHHARVYTQLPGVTLAGVADTRPEKAAEVAKRHHCRAYVSYEEMLDQVDVVSIVVPTSAHFKVAKAVLERGISVLLEKPMTQTVAEADELIQLARSRGAALQVGHIERFNQAIQELKRLDDPPRFIEVHRLGPYPQRSMDIGVVLDLMIHDLDIILDLVQSPVAKVDAMGVKILSDHEDIANARLTLANGCVANVTASRVTLETKRKIRLFSSKYYVSIDYQKQELTLYQLRKDLPPGEQNLMRMIHREHRTFGKQEPLVAELSSFVTAVREGRSPEVSGEAGRQALSVALQICEQIQAKSYSAA